MRIRRFRLRELARVLEIERASFGPDSYGVTTFLVHVLRDRKGFFVAETEEHGVVGYVLVRLGVGWPRKRRGGVTSIAVEEQHRRQGIGRALVERALCYLRENGVKEADLEVNTTNRAAHSLYESFGFHWTRNLPDYYGPDRHGMRMALDLSAEADGRAAAPRGRRRREGVERPSDV